MKASRLFALFAAAAVLCAGAHAQNPAGEATGERQRFARDGLSFEYPAGWTLEDKSDADVQHLLLTRAGASAVVRVVAYRAPVATAEQAVAASQNIWRPYAEDLARKLGITKSPAWDEMRCVKVGGVPAPGVRLGGSLGGRPTTGEVYALLLGRRYVNVFYVRADSDDALGGAAWQSVLDTMKVEGYTPEDVSRKVIPGGVLNGKALKKAPPEYPAAARAERASGTVTVQILVDEAGDVVSAKAVAGHPLLRGPSEKSVMLWKFSPTKLCDQPVKVSGVVTVNYVYR